MQPLLGPVQFLFIEENVCNHLLTCLEVSVLFYEIFRDFTDFFRYVLHKMKFDVKAILFKENTKS